MTDKAKKDCGSSSVIHIRITSKHGPDITRHWSLQELYWAVENGEAEIVEHEVNVPASKGDDYRCQFCGEASPVKEWKDDKCPCCGLAYDAMLAQEEDDG